MAKISKPYRLIATVIFVWSSLATIGLVIELFRVGFTFALLLFTVGVFLVGFYAASYTFYGVPPKFKRDNDT
ncbi:MAG: hypothetical protein Alis2KO_42000 [Aliiglaciecola sp.]